MEFLLALLLMSVLFAGIARVHAGVLQAFRRLQEGLQVQRDLRRAAGALDRELRMAGLRLPGRSGGKGGPGGPPGPLLQVFPGRPVAVLEGGRLRPCRPEEDPWERPPLPSDEVRLALEVPLEVPLRLGGPCLPGPPGPGGEEGAVETLRLQADHRLVLEAGDTVRVEDGAFEDATLQEAGILPAGAVVEVPLAAPGMRRAHPQGASVRLVRSRLREYRVVFRFLPEAREPVPCLVCFEAPLAEGAGALPPGARPRVLGEHIRSLRVEPLQEEGRPVRLRILLEARSHEPLPEGGPPGRARRRHLHRRLGWELVPWNPAPETVP